jgi:N-acetylglucosamine-6-sulfatase
MMTGKIIIIFCNRIVHRDPIDRLRTEKPVEYSLSSTSSIDIVETRNRVLCCSMVDVKKLVLLPLAFWLFDAQPCRATRQHQPQQPNFVILLMDDLDWTLGGMNASTLYRTRKLIADQGKLFSNWFVQTPVCCPSRAELLTGKFFHNLRASSSQKTPSCMHVDVAPKSTHPFYQRDYFASFFARLNYTVGIFGKHLNNDNPQDFIPAGVDEMLINGGGEYLDPTFTVGTKQTGSSSTNRPSEIKFDNCTQTTGMPCYSTSIIGNTSLAWITRHVESSSTKPFLAYIAPKAPHLADVPGGEGFAFSIPAPWYANTSIPEHQAPRIPNYNLSAPDHHWLVRTQKPFTKLQGEKVDELYVSRLKAMISVDDLVQELFQTLEQLRILDQTYVLFTSDNGFRMGSFKMPSCKLHPYENDIRVPMMIRGPGIQPGSVSSIVSSHVNIMPTLLGLATNQWNSQEVVPETMDGINLASHIIDGNEEEEQPLPSSLLIEYFSLGEVIRYYHLIDTYNHTFLALRIVHRHNYSNESSVMLNYKYVEFRDSRYDWNATQPPLEQEFFDLDSDPYEIHNMIDRVTPPLLEAMKAKMQRMFRCRGHSCRKEQLSALPGFQPSWLGSVVALDK